MIALWLLFFFQKTFGFVTQNIFIRLLISVVQRDVDPPQKNGFFSSSINFLFHLILNHELSLEAKRDFICIKNYLSMQWLKNLTILKWFLSNWIIDDAHTIRFWTSSFLYARLSLIIYKIIQLLFLLAWSIIRPNNFNLGCRKWE